VANSFSPKPSVQRVPSVPSTTASAGAGAAAAPPPLALPQAQPQQHSEHLPPQPPSVQFSRSFLAALDLQWARVLVDHAADRLSGERDSSPLYSAYLKRLLELLVCVRRLERARERRRVVWDTEWNAQHHSHQLQLTSSGSRRALLGDVAGMPATDTKARRRRRARRRLRPLRRLRAHNT